MYAYSYIPLIRKATRVHQSSSSLIDNIFTNNTDCESLNGILLTDITDHFLIYTITKRQISNQRPKTKLIRVFNEININKFKTMLQTTDWNPVLLTRDPQEGYNLFQDELVDKYNTAFLRKRN